MKNGCIILIVVIMVTNGLKGQIPIRWAQFKVEDTVNIPIETFWGLALTLKLEEIGSSRNYKDLPIITKTSLVKGDFSGVGDSRRVHFDSGQTLLETIIDWQYPNSFAYELTELEIELRKVADKARGHFQYFPLDNNRTRIVWTYGFKQKNFIFKWLIGRYIKRTHQFWMKDTLSEMIRLTEKQYERQANCYR